MAILARAPLTRACGSSGPGGVSACSLAEHEEAERPVYRLGASGVYTSTAISFSHLGTVPETREAAVLMFSYAPTAKLELHATAGATLGGRLASSMGTFTFRPGFASGLGAAYRFVQGQTPVGRGFVVGSLDVTATGSMTESQSASVRGPAHASYEAYDARLGAAVGLTWANVVSAYAIGRAFGGPVFWDLPHVGVGTDTHHYQVGGGLTVLVARRFELFVEGVPLGERAVAGGVAVAF
jgi:hypothetical protein